jgi:type IV secretory pathway VirB6-like protein
MKYGRRIKIPHTLAICLAVAVTVFFLSLADVQAQIIPFEPADICTDGPQFDTSIPSDQNGVLTDLTAHIKTMTTDLDEKLFKQIQGDTGFTKAIAAMLTLYVGIYGMLFMTGHVRASLHDFVIRCAKIAILSILATPDAWDFFNPYISDFFTSASDEFMAQVNTLLIGGTKISGVDFLPMNVLDQGLAKVISVNMGVHLLALLFAPPYGLFYLVLLGIAVWSFLGLLVTGIWVYMTSLVFRSLLVGVAPFFIACLLFSKTKHLFDGWLNQLISSCLQPVLLFTFLSFFVLMITGPGGNNGLLDKILNVPVCWTAASESLQGSPFNVHFWRFTVDKKGEIDPPSGTAKFEPYGGQWDFYGAKDAPPSPGKKPFPIELIPLITFLILAELGKRFSQTVLMIARELSASSVDLSDMRNVFAGLMPTESPGGTAVSGKSAAAAAALKDTIKKEGTSQAFTKTMADNLASTIRHE